MTSRFGSFLLFFVLLLSCKPAQVRENHLAGQTSAYLLQHVHNPVDWYPWGKPALEKAQQENKLIVVSIGYAACHWCHVMERESFSDTTVARIMNQHFVSIKVDREERPDVDDVYMSACQLVSDQGCGWPLNAIALPDGRPVWAGTYFPKEEWLKILGYFQDAYAKDPQTLLEYAEDLVKGVRTFDQAGTVPMGLSEFAADTLAPRAARLLAGMDPEWGGRRGEPKFPMPGNLEFLLRYHWQTGDAGALEAVKTQLDRMAGGGLYDHLGGGFARYSVDGRWQVPHFEKMLYDNAQLLTVYSQAYQATADPLYAQVIRETIAFLQRDMKGKEGGYFSSIDAESEGEEGRFYVWTARQIDSLLGGNPAFSAYYQITEAGNWEKGKNVLFPGKGVKPMPEWEDARKTLFAAREQRPKPRVDAKVLTSWNGLLVKGLADAYRALGEEAYRQEALRLGDFLWTNNYQAGKGLARVYAGNTPGFLDDYAHLIGACITLYEISFDPVWLERATTLTDEAMEMFFDSASPLLFLATDLHEALVARRKEISDNVMPSSNAAFARHLYRLGILLDDAGYTTRAQEMLTTAWSKLSDIEDPTYFAHWAYLYADQVFAPYEIVVAGAQAAALRDGLLRHFLPAAVVLGGSEEGDLELMKGKIREGATLVYVCRSKVCKLPTPEVEKALEQILPPALLQ